MCNVVCLQVPCVLFYRLIVWTFSCIFKTSNPAIVNMDRQFEFLLDRKGGWWQHYYQQRISVRDNFYIFLALRFKKGGHQELEQFLDRLTNLMTNEGQIPYEIIPSWYNGPVALYNSKRCDTPVVDANLQYIIMVHWLHKHNPKKASKLYLYCQRAWQWLDVNIVNDTLHEEIDASWETSRKHNGVLLLTNILMIKTIRCMELLSMYANDERKQRKFVKMHEQCVAKWLPEIYKTQEVLPRILAVHFGIAPRSFIQSFNESIHSVWIPCRLNGPIQQQTTLHSRIYGYNDQHDSVVWPWIGMLWILVLNSKGFKELANAWWVSYIEFHRPETIYDMYSQETKLPLRRAFLKGQPCHTLSIAMQIIVQKQLTKQTV
jgi:hypothetical protein